MKTPMANANPQTAEKLIELFDVLVKQGHLHRFALQHPQQFYQFAARVMPYYLQQQQAAQQQTVEKRPRSFMRLADGTELDF